MLRFRSILLANLAFSFVLSAPACVELLGGEGQSCAPDGRCGVGLFCEANVCRAPQAGSGGAPQTGGNPGSESGGGSAGEVSEDAGGSKGGDEMGSGGRAAGTGGTGAGGSENPEGAGGAPKAGGSPSAGGNESGGGSSAGGTSSGGAPLGPNLLPNGDFSDGAAHWKLEGGGGTFQGVRDGAYCIESESDVDFGLSAPGEDEEPFALESGTAYVLSYRVRGSLHWTAKVGRADSPYTAFGEWQEDLESSSSFQSFIHTFTVQEGNERVGFIFQGRGKGEFCFDDVVIASSE